MTAAITALGGAYLMWLLAANIAAHKWAKPYRHTPQHRKA